MPLFGRPIRTTANPNGTTTTTNGVTGHEKSAVPAQYGSSSAAIADEERFPGFGGWFQLYGIDLLTMAALGAVALGVYEAKPAPTRSFPIDFTDGTIVWPEFGYPLRKNIIPIWLAALLAWIIPTLFFSIGQIKIRSFWRDWHMAELTLLSSLILASTFQVFLKWLIGGLRPHFLAVCQPNVTAPGRGNGFQSAYYTRAVCTGDQDEIDDSLESFPSGHSTAAFAGFVVLSLWFNAHLKIFGPVNSRLWKQVLFLAPLLGATLIAGSLTIDEYHNWYDCLAGAIIGTLCAFVSWRSRYRAIWDWRYNHLTLPRGSSEAAMRDFDAGMLRHHHHDGAHGMNQGPLAGTTTDRPLSYPQHHGQAAPVV